MEEKSKALQVLELTPIQDSTVFQVGSENPEQEAKAAQVPLPTPMTRLHDSVVHAVDVMVQKGVDPSEVMEVMLKAFEMGKLQGQRHRQLLDEYAAIVDSFIDYVQGVVYRLRDLNFVHWQIADTLKAEFEKVLDENLQVEDFEE